MLNQRKFVSTAGAPEEPKPRARTFPPEAAPVGEAAPAGQVMHEAPEEAVTPLVPDGESASAEYKGPLVKLDSDMILASVNGVAITLKDLMPVNPRAKTERKMTPEMFNFLMDRAIVREVAMQAAKSKGLELSEEQKANLEKVRARALEKDPRVFSDAQDDYEAKAAFEVKDYTGLMLAESLLALSGGPPKYVTPEMVERYYAGHSVEYGELPADESARKEMWPKIDNAIRETLAGALESDYEKGLQALMDDLKKKASITRNVQLSAAAVPSGGSADSN
jgi:hypothetical protein